MKGHITIFILIDVEQSKFLLTSHVVIGTVAIQNNRLRIRDLESNERIDQLFAYSKKIV